MTCCAISVARYAIYVARYATSVARYAISVARNAISVPRYVKNADILAWCNFISQHSHFGVRFLTWKLSESNNVFSHALEGVWLSLDRPGAQLTHTVNLRTACSAKRQIVPWLLSECSDDSLTSKFVFSTSKAFDWYAGTYISFDMWKSDRCNVFRRKLR